MDKNAEMDNEIGTNLGTNGKIDVMTCTHLGPNFVVNIPVAFLTMVTMLGSAGCG